MNAEAQAPAEQHSRFPAGYIRWLWVRIQRYILVSFVLANLCFLWAAFNAGKYGVLGAIAGFWLLAFFPAYEPYIKEKLPGFDRAILSGSALGLTAQIPVVMLIIAGVLLLWGLSSTLPRPG